MPKVLILTETVGGNGHLCAAKAIRKALKQLDPTIEIRLINGLALVSRHLENTVRHTYMHTLRFAPRLWGHAYEQEKRLSTLFQTPLGNVLAYYLQEVIKREQPDVVVCTHAFCLSAIAKLRSKYSFRLGAAITDFDVNGFWMHDEVDFYLVAHADMRDKIVKSGYTKAEIVATGIPIDPLFSELSHQTRPSIRRKLGLNHEQRTVLLMGGGLGLGPIDRMIGKLVDAFVDDVQIVVVTGKNETLRKKCEALLGDNPTIHIFGYIEELANYIAAADLIVTKPGGLTSSEALAMGVPIIMTQPIPGQEERNSRFLLSQQVALRVTHPLDICRYVRPFIEDTLFYEQFTAKARQTGRPASAQHAAKVIVNVLDQGKKKESQPVGLPSNI